jgi:hypothetical protein
VIRFHARTLSPRRLPLALWHEGAGDYPQVIEDRHSAAAFAAVPLGDDAIAAIAERCAELLRAVEHSGAPRMRASIVTVRSGAPPAARRVRCDGSLDDRRHRLGEVDETACRLVRACQAQEIVRGSAFGVVVGVELESLARLRHEGYRAAALGAGMVCASLYREAARRRIGTTSIGGFHSQLIRDIVNADTWWPLAVQVFGVEERASAKVDAAVLPIKPIGRNKR